MKRACLLLFSLLTCGFPSGCSREEPRSPEAGQRTPNFSLPNLNGERISLADLKRNKLVLINFWATWCAPCKEEVPLLISLHQRYRDRGLAVVGISVEERQDMVTSFCNRNKIDYTVLLDGEAEVAKRYAVLAFPTTFIVNQDGVVLFSEVKKLDESVMPVIEKLLETPGAPRGAAR